MGQERQILLEQNERFVRDTDTQHTSSHPGRVAVRIIIRRSPDGEAP